MSNKGWKQTRNYDGPWNRRIYDVAGSLGWNLTDLARRMGYRTVGVVTRVLDGGMPDVRFLLALGKLEKAYEGEIAEFIRQKRPFKLFRRRRMENGNPRANRPQDISEVGNVASLGAPSAASIRADKRRTRAKVLRLTKRRAREKKNRKTKARRSEDFRYRLWKLARKTDREARIRGRLNGNQKEKESSGD